MKKARKPKLAIQTLAIIPTEAKGPDGDDPITTSGTICTLPGRL
ncbi:hypothetical protein SAMN04487996_111289 [Dyadobacter soli]|uniref:Uncharacterized protein n=1 Tax=Dyadobacter soli TaxID=659014 RepID=A0A1G7MJC0_9BACT|nr:hypothetical protein [Dyadobacter soli]SDF61774.1 hypothetical protein SAMN04487996_111289 [Dyadobacter soli]